MAELWEGRGLGSWLHDSTAPPKLSFTLLAYGKFELRGHSGQRLPVQFPALCPRSAHSWLPHQRAKVQENMHTTNLGKSGPGWLTPRGPRRPERAGCLSRGSPWKRQVCGWEDRTQEKADRHAGSEDQTERPENTPGWSWTHLGARRITGEGAAGLGAPRTQAAPGSSSEWALRNVSSPSSTAHLSHQRVTIGSADK